MTDLPSMPRMADISAPPRMADRFRGFLPVIVDVETGGFDWERHALLEIAAVVVRMDEFGFVHPDPVVSTHVEPFPGSELDPRSMEITGIDPGHPFRAALPERAALDHIFKPVREAVRDAGCQRAILVGHNAAFDIGVLNAAIRRTAHKRSPFHPFSCFDTVTLGGLAYGQTVLSRAVEASGRSWDSREAHAAVYDVERTAELFCGVVNRWKQMDDFWRARVSASP
ncbi:MAG: ribonuclease T [Rhodanobacteraceae bacterium]